MPQRLPAQLNLINQTLKTTTDTSLATQEPINLLTLNKELENTEKLLSKHTYDTQAKIDASNQFIEIEKLTQFISEKEGEISHFKFEMNTHFFLFGARLNWQHYLFELKTRQTEIQKLIRSNQKSASPYQLNLKKWKASLPGLKNNIGQSMLERIESNVKLLQEIDQQYQNQYETLLKSELTIAESMATVYDVIYQIERLIEQERQNILKKTQSPIYKLNFAESFDGSFAARLSLAYQQNKNSIGYFYRGIGTYLVVYIITLTILLFAFIFIRRKYLLLNYNESHLGYKKVYRILINKPILTFVAIVSVLWIIFIPYNALVISKLIFFFILLIINNVLAEYFDYRTQKVSKTLLFLLILQNLEIIFWYFGQYATIYLLVESIAGIMLTIDFILPKSLRRAKKQNQNVVLHYLQLLSPTLFIFSLISLISVVFGYIDLAVYLMKVGVQLGTSTIIIYGFLMINQSLLQSSVDVLSLYYPDFVIKSGERILKKGNQLLSTLLGIVWVISLIQITEVLRFFNLKLINILTYEVNLGSFSVALVNLILFISIIYITFSITGFIKHFIEREVLAKRNLKRGVPAAISLTSRMLVSFVGMIIALSISGLDLGKLSIIAGALSVGIGFGLQNVVNNFISGLILVYERPVQEGDTVEVENLMGKVTNIGIRSSNVLTYDGAEVIVPNSNLISNQLINWTLSDSRRRLEIIVGTSYNSDPSIVIKLLHEVAIAHPKVIADPAPLALFTGFGDSSLNFRLLFWVYFEDSMKTRSDVGIAVYQILKKNNIEIPFPQMDVHLKAKAEAKPEHNISEGKSDLEA
jgi:small-conductance mechanosensitive channel